MSGHSKRALSLIIQSRMPNLNFELAAYEDILKTALSSSYRFLPYDRIQSEGCELSCLLRHDLDSELLGCGPMLDIERRLGVQATYFVMTRSTAYNPFSVEGRSMVRRILDEGHALGLHFMGELCEGEEPSVIAAKVRREVNWLEDEFSTGIRAVSFHQPSRAVLDGQLRIPNLVNTYNRSQMGAYFYVSDTNMQWRHEHPLEIFERRLYPRLQLLIHPIWWTSSSRASRDKWLDILRTNNRAVTNHWEQRERTLAGVRLGDII